MAGNNEVRTARSGESEGRDSSQVIAYLREYAQRRSGKVAPASALPLDELKAKIARAHTPLVESIARRFASSGEPFDDLVQEGFIGLLSALDNYDPQRPIKFSTYATHFVAGTIRHFLRDRGKMIKEPAWLHELSVKVARATETLSAKLGRAPEPAEIAKSLNLTEEAVEEILSTRQTFQVAAFGSSSDDDSDCAVGLVDPEKIRSDKHVTLQLPVEDRIVLENAVQKLKDLEQRVLFEFFYQDHTQTEIAKRFGISCNYVSHILKNATGKLKKIIGEAEVRDRTRSASAPSTLTCASTGLLSPAQTLSRFNEALGRSARENRPCAVLCVQVENLPERGTEREDMLAKIGEVLRTNLRKVDIAGRAENAANDFLVFLPQRDAEQAKETAMLLEERLQGTDGVSGEKIGVRVGVGAYPVVGRSLTELITIARGGVLPLPVRAARPAPLTAAVAGAI